MSLLMGIDLGTSSLKIIVIDEKGSVVAQSARAYALESPAGGYAEQNPETWWNACVECIKEVLTVCPAEDIMGISFSGQMHGLVALDQNFLPVRPAILHCDVRSSKQVSLLERLFTREDVIRLMLNPIYTGFLLPSLLWMQANEPEKFEKTKHVCLPKDYLKLKLTGDVTSDYSDASATLAFDIENLTWSDEILSKTGICQSIFPVCYETTEKVGTVSKAAAEQTGLKAGTAVIAGGGDQVMQGIGNGASGLDKATVNIGSSGQVCFHTERAVRNPALSTNCFCGYKKGRWILFGATMTAGLSLSWWNKILGEMDYKKLNEEVEQIKPGSGGILYLPYLNGERTPHVNPNISGMFMGVNLETTKAHMTRAVMEGVTYSLMDCIESCQSLGYEAQSLVASGGGARSKTWLQIQADVFNLPLAVAKTQEQASLGAAIAAGVGTGIYKDLNEGTASAVHFNEEIVIPNKENHRIYQDYYALYKKAYVDSKDVLNKVTELGRDG